MSFQLEVIAFNIESCVIAERSGANRIELCDNPHDGGTTPSLGMIQLAREKTTIQLFPIIRPRAGDFLYSEDEFSIMKRDIRACKEIGCDGVVFGILNPDGTVDARRTMKLVELAYPLEVTFHRAFDRVEDPYDSLEIIIEAGCQRILTSGCKPTALEGAFTIQQLVKQADERIIVMPGSGVRSSNILDLIKETGAKEFHTSARISTQSNMEYQNPLMNENLESISLDESEIKKILSLLKTEMISSQDADGAMAPRKDA
ncbi:MAG: copper homeostasis protein CutC [Bacteroidetes bacterium]|nr:MAG: copper homeostasis protein CutC [Bacteroidota bacterium]